MSEEKNNKATASKFQREPDIPVPSPNVLTDQILSKSGFKKVRLVATEYGKREDRPSKITINLGNNRPASKFFSELIPVEIGFSDYFRHRWLKGFGVEYRLDNRLPVSEDIDLQEILKPKSYDY